LIKMDEKTKKELIQKIGIRAYMMLKPSINKAEDAPNTPVYHVTDCKELLKNKKYIHEKIKNLTIFKSDEWYKYVYKKLDKEDKKKIREKLKNYKNSENG